MERRDSDSVFFNVMFNENKHTKADICYDYWGKGKKGTG
jgi:hypothetical protein